MTQPNWVFASLHIDDRILVDLYVVQNSARNIADFVLKECGSLVRLVTVKLVNSLKI